MMAGLAALALVLQPAPPAAGPAEYRACVEDYRAGGYAAAVEALGAVPEAVVDDEIRRRGRRPRCRSCPELAAWGAWPFPAAVLVHTERAFLDLENGRRASAEFNFTAARAWLRAGGPGVDLMAPRWHLACALNALWWLESERAEQEVVDGLRGDRSEARLWLAGGAAAELRGRQETDRGNAREALRTAEERYRRALDLDSRLAEARLRRAQVLARLGRNPEAAAELDALTRARSEPWVAYLAALFRGRLAEDRRAWEAAATSYRAAATLLPAAEAAWVALAHALDRGGDRAGAEAAAGKALGASGVDPYRAYFFGPRGIMLPLFEELRGEAR